MGASIFSITESGSDTYVITIECAITRGLPNIIIVGLATKTVDEAKERIRAAFHASKLDFPKQRITINLAPADIPKESSSFDVGIAVAIMQAAEQIEDTSRDVMFFGELGLRGNIRPVRGIIGKLLGAKKAGYRTFYLPISNLEQAKLVPDITIIPVSHLKELYESLAKVKVIEPVASGMGSQPEDHTVSTVVDMQDISGQTRAKRVLEIAAAGGHNVLFNGPPGTGKSMLAKALPGILPPMDITEMLEVTHLHSLAGHDFSKIMTTRPFRSPHHGASNTAIIGGGQQARPGEITLAHRGVLLLDELPEYGRATVESLRQPLEDKVITIARAKANATYPADFMLVATSNPCPCGFYGTGKVCTCQPYLIAQYQRKLSGPIVDRIDLYTEVDNVEHAKLLQNANQAESSTEIRKRVIEARKLQKKRYNTVTKTNALLTNKEIKKLAHLSDAAELLLNQAAEKLDISARSYMRLIKVARTIADLADSLVIEPPHISEAIQYRKQTAQ